MLFGAAKFWGNLLQSQTCLRHLLWEALLCGSASHAQLSWQSPIFSPTLKPPTSALTAQPGLDSASDHDGPRQLILNCEAALSVPLQTRLTPSRPTPVSPSWPASLISSIQSKSLLPWAPQHLWVRFREHHGPD